ncbi:MAG TPA: hypothetical protein DD420_05265 [Streptomyces sp.]|nr:hypothetical protein [Streptomyces sp.]
MSTQQFLSIPAVRAEAEALYARLIPMERRQLRSVIEVVLSAPDLGYAFLELMDEKDAGADDDPRNT